MKTITVNCDSCGSVFEPENGIGEIKVTFTIPNDPIISEFNGIKTRIPNNKGIRMNELCPKCSEKILLALEPFLNKTETIKIETVA